MNQQLESTFLEALKENQSKLLRVCSVYAKNRDDKKDLFQESLFNIWKSLPDFEGKSSLSTWMFRITLNVCLQMQSQLAKKQSGFKPMDSIEIDNIRVEEKSDEQSIQLVQLRNCIRKLNEADKAVITLHLEELPYREISSITGLTENNIAVKVKRIKKKLWNCITQGHDRG